MPRMIVIPCYNEEARLAPDEVRRLAATPETTALLVDDGSSDGTRALLEEIARTSSGRVRALALEENEGKAEAVRRGLLAALDGGADVVGYVDADFSTPVEEVRRLLVELERPGVSVAMGARVARAGADIRRRFLRHMVGRVFATGASLILGQPFYDTQCGAKVFKDTPALRDALGEPFLSRWAFDVELLGRLLEAHDPLPFSAFVEVPLETWVDVGDSKLGGGAMAIAGLDLVRVRADLARRRRR
jgi:dolichyl-phosphate beta-glucosyltransferase